VHFILKKLNKPETLIQYVQDRPGHDVRYSLNTTKIQEQIGWKPVIPFMEGLNNTVQWYLDNEKWWLSNN
jgi:dTDP-glucose 4,6-dehydratase